MTETEQVVTQMRNEASQFLDKVYEIKKKLSVSGAKSTKWFNHGIADIETGLSRIEKAFLSTSTTKRSRKEQGQSQPQSPSYRSSNNS